MDVLTVVVPETHIWAILIAWIGCYAIGHVLGGGFR